MIVNTRHKGKIGENIACTFVEKQGFIITERNYQKAWGEIDIIGKSGSIIHFFEVKSISVTSLDDFEKSYRPEENVHGLKVRNIRRMIETYMSEKGYNMSSQAFAFHVLCVFKDIKFRKARVKWIKNLVL